MNEEFYKLNLKIQLEELLALYCSSLVLVNNDIVLEYIIYEELNSDYSLLNSEGEFINELEEFEIINSEIKEKLKKLYNLLHTIYETNNERSAYFIRNSKEWKNIFNFVSKIIFNYNLFKFGIPSQPPR